MSDETTLLPCPFCGGEAECHQWWSATISGKYATVCTKCNCGTDYYATEAEAIAAWNQRHVETCENTQHDADFMCSKCGKCVDNGRIIGFNFCPNCGRKVVG